MTARLIRLRPPRYASALAPVQARFAAVVVLDGSRLAAIAHRLKLLWPDRRVVLPGALLAVYDLGRGLCRTLRFSADAFSSELADADPVVASLAADTLVVGDRAYGHPVFFARLHRQRRLGGHPPQSGGEHCSVSYAWAASAGRTAS